MACPSVTLLFYHGRYISEGPKKLYVGGSVTPLTIDPDMMSYMDLRAVVKELECPDVSELYQKSPNQTMDDGLVGVTCDKTMVAMFDMHKDNNSTVIDIYIHNPMMEHNKPSGEEVSTLTKVGPSMQTDDLVDLLDFDDIVDLNDIVNLDEGIIPTGPLEGDDDSDKDWEIGDETDDESDGDSHDGTGDDTDDFSGFADSSEDEEEEEEVEKGIAIMTVNEEGECSDKSDDDLGCLSNLEDEGGNIKKHKLVEFDKDKDMENPRLVEGMVFPNVTAFRALLKEFHIREVSRPAPERHPKWARTDTATWHSTQKNNN
ncbi:hypothetical protein RHMOL_Rhmol09G0218100 [Rhododendron molle]|uniref:Uncharacterized protein n=1 Tax=Rhododendron molle TaxID=49168 RepID=A0ACC0MG75_RHOML|nr:hypothetical protein RHMOL_Rhmol09G0218100 [Rhododendron molle]